MRRQSMLITIPELRDLADELEHELRRMNTELMDDEIMGFETKFQINIINEDNTSDGWRIEK